MDQIQTIMDIARSWGWLAAMVLNGFIVWIGWSLRSHYQQFATKTDLSAATTSQREQIEKHQETEEPQLRDMQMRIGLLETQLQNMPTHKDIETLRLSMEALARSHSEMVGEFRSVRDQLGTVSSYLLHRRRTDPVNHD